MESENFTQNDFGPVLDSLDGIRRAEMPAFFYTRLQARLEKQTTREGAFWKILAKPAFSILTLSLLVVLNVAAIRFFTRNQQASDTKQTSAIQKFANEYDLGITSVYAENSDK
ncbi:MAG: hypothetical protein KGO92_04095 [Bacteroidota bacterium]|nr:hypothetical protein [Bacteroidota bacterium]